MAGMGGGQRRCGPPGDVPPSHIHQGLGREEQTEPMPAPRGCCPPQIPAGCGLDAAGMGGSGCNGPRSMSRWKGRVPPSQWLSPRGEAGRGRSWMQSSWGALGGLQGNKALKGIGVHSSRHAPAQGHPLLWGAQRPLRCHPRALPARPPKSHHPCPPRCGAAGTT